VECTDAFVSSLVYFNILLLVLLDDSMLHFLYLFMDTG
jgi:hypothetical protein